MLPFDLHVLSMPPAFNLSQDQTLQFNPQLISQLALLLLLFTALFLKHSISQSAHTVCLLIFLINPPRRRDAYSTHLSLYVKYFFMFFCTPGAFLKGTYLLSGNNQVIILQLYYLSGR